MYDIMKAENKYWDRKNYTSLLEYNTALEVSATVYVGNLSFYTQQGAIKELFSRAGNVKDIIMGIDNDGNPCGFCFVV
jgi:nuclear cap-binding protein subunit 2